MIDTTSGQKYDLYDLEEDYPLDIYHYSKGTIDMYGK